MIRLITFATDDFTISADRLKATALRHGVDDVVMYKASDNLDNLFHIYFVKPLLPNSRGYGWWIWKPAIIWDGINRLNEGDYLIYCDAGTEIVGPLQSVIDAMDEDIFFCSNGWQHSHWCKAETAKAINGEMIYYDGSKIWPLGIHYFTFKQVQASFIIFKVTDKVKAFVQEWYAWSIMPGMIDNTPRGPQFPEFQEHRHDQAILTCLQIKYGYKLHWFPSTMNHHQLMEGDNYPQILNHHRKRNNEW